MFAATASFPVSADNDTSHNSESFVAGGGYIYFGGWAVSRDMKYVIQFPTSIERVGDMYVREDLSGIPNAYAYSGVVGMKSGTYVGEGNQFVLVCFTLEDNPYRVVDIAFTVTKPHVVLDKQEGSGGTDSFDVEYGDYPGNITVPSRENYEFLGYYTKPGGQGTKYINGNGTPARTWGETGGTSNTPVTTYTLYAYWRAHSIGDTVIENFIAPTCLADGSYDVVQYCGNTLDHNTTKNYFPTYTYFEKYTEITDYKQEATPIDITETTQVTNNECHLEMSRSSSTIPALGHSPADAVEESYVDPTCTEDGGYDTVIYCGREDCGEELSRVHTIIPATAHKNTEIIGEKSPSLTEEGFSGKVVCIDCGEVLDSGHIIEKLTVDDINPEDIRDILDKEIKTSDETQKQLEDLLGDNPGVVLEIISNANNTLSDLKEKLVSGQISKQEYEKAIKTIEEIIEVCVSIGTESIQSVKYAEKIEDKLPKEFELNLSDLISEFYIRQIEELFNEDNTMDLTVTKETFLLMQNAIDTYVNQMIDAALELKQCSGKEIVAQVNKVVTAISTKTFRDFDKEVADEEFAQNAYNAVLLNMQTQVKTMLTKEYESATSSNKYKGTAKKQLIEKYESEIATIDDLATFEIMVTEVMRQKYVSVMDERLKTNAITGAEYNELISLATDVDTFAPVYKEIFRVWALGLENEYGISLEELTKATISSAQESIKPDTYKKEEKETNESVPKINNIFKLAKLNKDISTDVLVDKPLQYLQLNSFSSTNSIDTIIKRRIGYE